MENDKVTKLTPHPSSMGYAATEGTILSAIDKFIEDHELFEYDDQIENDIELEAPRPDELKLGALTSFERRCYAIAKVVDSVIKDALIDYEAGAAEAVTAIMRENKIPYYAAVQEHIKSGSHQLPDDDRVYLNKLSVLLSTMQSSYDFGVRSRYNEFSRTLIVRAGFVAYAYVPANQE